VDAAASQILAQCGSIDGLVNTTSVSDFGPFISLDDDVWMNVLNTKLIGYVRTMRAVLSIMTAKQKGVIVNLSGRGGKQPTVTHLPGGSANAAVNLLGKGISDAFIGQGVRVNTLVPGPIESERLNDVLQTSGEMSARSLQTYSKPGKPDDVARVVVWLLSDDSSHVVGAMIPVDGGSTYTV
jgi:NAD(P)-dependent dehydrogenase (short-subunit alcohol dehydrogenase family)